MRQVKIFSGSSHPLLTESICERLGTQPAKCELKKFSNGETSVSLGTSIREQDVFIVQSGSNKINDSVMELLIMISACKGGSAKSITGSLHSYSKKKSHRGAIAARMLANLLSVAGVQHVITVDLHASQSQGFFGKPVDNLYAEPLIARWIRNHVPGWREAVVVSKNPGGTKRVTSLADALKLNFGIVTTDRRRHPLSTTLLDGSGILYSMGDGANDVNHNVEAEAEAESQIDPTTDVEVARPRRRTSQRMRAQAGTSHPPSVAHRAINVPAGSSPLVQSTRFESESPPMSRNRLPEKSTASIPIQSDDGEDATNEYTDERAREVITGRLIHGHIVDDDFPSPVLSAMSGSITTLPRDHLGSSQFEEQDPMMSSFVSTTSTYPHDHALGGTGDAGAASDEEEEGFKNAELEHTITLVGDVKDKIVFIMDDMIDRAGSWIAAAETVVKRGDAKKVYCVATHGLFGGDSLEEMENCNCIDYIVVTNSYPIAPEKVKASKKLVVLDLSHLLAEAIRRNHYGESISALFQHYQD
ncbi:ribose-phosphate pyrophosphokinase [Lasallia pustulata]|uniref:Ribose-phosphate pyrophosphokinase 1 n=1 Tax=Lasallia pustulata TaxID=136370 RepID=A0A1W5CTR4_9LECA|nr:ribose-phosphate pyrophosphokinase [Lasallia pustulata]